MAVQLDDDGAVWALDLGMVNAYLVDDGTVTLVDAGTPGAETLERELGEAGYNTDELDRILVTHYDFDHVGGLAALGSTAPIYAMEPDASLLDGTDRPTVLSKKGAFQRVAAVFQRPPGTGVSRIEDGETVGGFTAYHTPGHTPGHTAFHHGHLGVAMLGDLVTGDGNTLGTPPWPLAASNRQNDGSIQALASRDLSFDIACMGHGDPVTDRGDDELDALAASL
ncbi:Glyoxylase, beta-lactamase superfamily II [Halovenus aranensis]|uniref:Glyoxylase, beta-lactamase superfamily II n=1 Tax=Halovenus aranensis TaxID=890420 RepID=A0A1G8VE15_9EURY|nr:MBL fold metallo-hydrolase [Halovenus aranensis]SDJ64336.1 Glyoxylase, beta-lactamase superfamily II [Halovenus aranensis]